MKPAITRFPAQDLENVVMAEIQNLLQAAEKCTIGIRSAARKEAIAQLAQAMAKAWPTLESGKKHEFVREVMKVAVLGETTVWIEVQQQKLIAALLGENSLDPWKSPANRILKLEGKFEALRRGGDLQVFAPNGAQSQGNHPSSLIRMVARARDWYEQIIGGEITSINQLAQESGVTPKYARRLLRLVSLSPRLAEELLAGNNRNGLPHRNLLRGIPYDWQSQRDTIQNATN